MCAGKLFALIKKCLSRKQQQLGCTEERGGTASASPSCRCKCFSGAARTIPPSPTGSCCASPLLPENPHLDSKGPNIPPRIRCPCCRRHHHHHNYHRHHSHRNKQQSHLIQTQQPSCLGASRPAQKTPASKAPVVFVPSRSSTDRDRGVSGCISRASMSCPPLDLPPSIAITLDGEESYPASQRLLSYSISGEVGQGIVSPPPNKTINEIFDSQLPCRSYSYSSGTCCGGTQSPHKESSAGGSGRVRCHSVSAQSYSRSSCCASGQAHQTWAPIAPAPLSSSQVTPLTRPHFSPSTMFNRLTMSGRPPDTVSTEVVLNSAQNDSSSSDV